MNLVLIADNHESVEAGIRAGAETICFEPCGFPYLPGGNEEDKKALVEASIRSTLDTCRVRKTRFIWKLPRITRQAELEIIQSLLPRLHAAGLGVCMVDNPGAALAVAGAAPDLTFAGSWGLNVFNAETVRMFSRQSFGLLLLSPELTGSEIADLVRAARLQGNEPELAVFVQGNLETMVTEDCLRAVTNKCRRISGTCKNTRWLGLHDETGRLFPVRVDGACRSHLFNAAETCLVDAVPDLVQSGVDAIVIDARGRSAAYTKEIVGIYRDAIRVAVQKPGARGLDFAAYKDRVKAIALGGITAGHYARGLKEE